MVRSSSRIAVASWSMEASPSTVRLAWPEANSTSEFEHEAVADHANVLAVAQQLAQPAEEVGAVALQLLHLLGQQDVEAGAEVGDAHLAVLVLGLVGVDGLLQGRHLLPQLQPAAD